MEKNIVLKSFVKYVTLNVMATVIIDTYKAVEDVIGSTMYINIWKLESLSIFALSISSVGTSSIPAKRSIRLYPNIFHAVIMLTKRITNPLVFNQNGDSIPNIS